MKRHKTPSKMTNFPLFAIKVNEENVNNYNSPIGFYFFGGGHVLSTQKPADLIYAPKSHFTINCLPEKIHPGHPMLLGKNWPNSYFLQ